MERVQWSGWSEPMAWVKKSRKVLRSRLLRLGSVFRTGGGFELHVEIEPGQRLPACSGETNVGRVFLRGTRAVLAMPILYSKFFCHVKKKGLEGEN